MPDPLPVQRGIARLWAKHFASEHQAFRSAEFSELALDCHTTYGAPEGAADNLKWHKGKLKTAFRNIGAPWYGGPSLDAAKVSEILHFGFTGGPCTRTYLMPLNEAPEGLPKLEFGPCRIGLLSEARLADIVKPAALERHHRTRFDLEALSEIVWLVISEPAELDSAKDRDFRPLSVNLGDLDEVPQPSPIPESLYRRPLQELRIHTQPVKIVNRALLTLLLHSWEDFVSLSHAVWRPFSIPWVYIANPDPFVEPTSAPDTSSLCWDSAMGSDGHVEERAPRASFLDGAFVGLEVKLSENCELLERTDRLLQETSCSAFGPLIEHFLLRAYWESGIDELIMHMTAIDAALGNRDFNKSRPKNRKYSGLAKALGARMWVLLSDPNVASQFCALYDRRSEYIHGRLAPSGYIAIEDLKSGRRLARRVARGVLEYTVKHPDRSRDAMLADLDGKAP